MLTISGRNELTCRLCDIFAYIKKITSSLFWTKQPTCSEIACNFKVQTFFSNNVGVFFFLKPTHDHCCMLLVNGMFVGWILNSCWSNFRSLGLRLQRLKVYILQQITTIFIEFGLFWKANYHNGYKFTVYPRFFHSFPT
jgi:hypothetical protein